MRINTRRLFLKFVGAASISAAMLFSLANTAVHAEPARQIDTAFGQVEVPVAAQRVVVLDEGALDTALSVGVQPIAALASRGGTDVADYLQQYVTEPIEIVGTVCEPNIEAICRLRPDLIFAPSDANE